MSADAKIALVVGWLRFEGHLTSESREHLAGVLEEARTIIRENCSKIPSVEVRKALASP